jgi:hypothetical protein
MASNVSETPAYASANRNATWGVMGREASQYYIRDRVGNDVRLALSRGKKLRVQLADPLGTRRLRVGQSGGGMNPLSTPIWPRGERPTGGMDRESHQNESCSE